MKKYSTTLILVVSSIVDEVLVGKRNLLVNKKKTLPVKMDRLCSTEVINRHESTSNSLMPIA